MKKKILIFITTLALLFSMAVPVFAADDVAAPEGSDGLLIASNTDGVVFRNFVDEAGLLTDSEAAELENKLEEITSRQQFDVVVVTVDSLNGASPMDYADDYFDYNGYGYGSGRDGCLLLIGLDTRDWWISTRGYGITALTDYGIQYIGDQIVPFMKDGDWDGAFNEYADLVDSFVSQAKNGAPVDTNNAPKAKRSAGQIIKGLFISLIIGLVVAFVVMKKVKNDYVHAVRAKANASDYLVDGSLNVTGAYDNFLYSNVTQTRIERDSSGGGSSTHTSSSGASHGGGGGKF